MGKWRQGKSSLVNALLDEEGKAETGRRQRITTKVNIYNMDAGDVGTILLADTPGLEPDTKYDIMDMFRKELKERGCSTDVLTDLIILVIAGHADGISSLSSQKIFEWIKETYAQARASSSFTCSVLPVITHGDFMDASTREADVNYVKDRLQELAQHQGRVANCHAHANVLPPMIVSNPSREARAGVDEVRKTVLEAVALKSTTNEFHRQWANMLTSDLEAMVTDFRAKFPNEETERRLFHRSMEALLATYGQRAQNLETALPVPNWALYHMIERKVRHEESQLDLYVGCFLSVLPCSPKEASPFVWAAGATFVVCKAYQHRDTARSLMNRMKGR
eukprot:TRINITY_DN7899_c0_g1_i1.p1 TRINITY_DN7899_c0_g1~~TRINITY_DN7899_c0_g1_i1.p1  ORF type:complete len:336 (-),score=67.40 TRINITY_DN7899_c0_g1_i1:51-1058(-)